MSNKHNKKGFTLVELTVVIAIMAIIAVIAVPTYFAVSNKLKKEADIEVLSIHHIVGEYFNEVAMNKNAFNIADTDASTNFIATSIMSNDAILERLPYITTMVFDIIPNNTLANVELVISGKKDFSAVQSKKAVICEDIKLEYIFDGYDATKTKNIKVIFNFEKGAISEVDGIVVEEKTA